MALAEPTPPVKIPRPTHWMSLLKFSVLAILFWLLEFLVQYHWLSKGILGESLVRSFAFSGATLIGAALFSSVIFRFIPRYAQYWRIRRYLGVWGVIFTYLHVLSVYHFYIAYDIGQIYPTLNPFKNPIVFGTIALPIFTLMALTSTDWAVDKLTPRRWKFIHRFVYVAYLAAIFHFITVNPQELKTLPGYLLLTLTIATVLGHLYLFFKTALRKKFRSTGTVVGFAIIILGILVGYTVYKTTFAP